MTEDATTTAAQDKAVDEDVVLSISSDAVPTRKLEIDGEIYEIYGYEHLSPQQEAKVTAVFAQFQNTYRALDKATKDQVAEKLGAKIRDFRERIIGLMTSIPRDVYHPLSAAKQGQILNVIQDEIGAEVDEDIDVDDDELTDGE